MTTIWQNILSWMDQWGAVKEWRRRRDASVLHQKPTYDAYPVAVPEPEVKIYLESRDVRGRLLREYVYLEGYSLHQINLRRGARRGNQLVGEWVWDSIIEAMVRLASRLDTVREEKEASDAQQAQK